MYVFLASTSYWQIDLGDLTLNDSAVEYTDDCTYNVV